MPAGCSAVNVLYVCMHAYILRSNCSSNLLSVRCVCVCLLCCLAGTSHRVSGSCLAFWMRKSRAGGVREGQSHSGNPGLFFSNHREGRQSDSFSLHFSFSPLSSFFIFLPSPSFKSLFLRLTLFIPSHFPLLTASFYFVFLLASHL